MENTTFNVSVILPIKSSKTVGFVDFFDRAIQSLTTQKVGVNELIIVHTNEDHLVEYLNNYDFNGLNVVKHVWTDEPNYASQVNFGVEKATSEWVTLFEFDDEYANIWFKNVRTYVNAYSDVEVFLPIVVDVDNKGVFAGFTNEATFAANFTQEIGVLTHDTLLEYQNFQTSGMAIKKSTFVENGGFKPSFKLTYGYEFFLRLTNRSTRICQYQKLVINISIYVKVQSSGIIKMVIRN